MNSELLAKVQADQLKELPDVKIGDTVKLHMRISEGDKSRIQVFEGIVLAIKGSGLDKTITVRKISSGIGVERIVPLHSPTLDKIEITKRGKVRQSKLYYMRDRVGRRAMKISGAQSVDIKLEEKDEVVISEVNTEEEKAEKKKEVSESSDETIAEVKEEKEVKGNKKENKAEK